MMIYTVSAVLSAAVSAFFITCCLLSGRIRERQALEKRINELRTDAELPSQKKQRIKRRKRTGQPNAAARGRKELEKLENQLYDTGIHIPVREFLTAWAATGLGLPLLLLIIHVNASVVLAAALTIAFVPVAYMKYKKHKRIVTLEGQLVEAISVLVSALRAGHSFQTAMSNIATEMDGPISEEFGRVFLETQHGITMAASMESMCERAGSADMEMLCTAILIQRDVGGNLAEVLENISTTIQDRLSLKAEIKTRTASGRLSGYIIGGLPVLLLLAIVMINPEYSITLFNTSMGHMMLTAGGVLEVLGFFFISRIVSVKY